MAKFEIPEGWTVQAFRFTLDPTDDQTRMLARHFGARRKAYNWTVAALKADIEAWQATGIQTARPSLRVLRKRWNAVKNEVCVNADTGTVWWRECSKEAYADGIDGAVDAYWNCRTPDPANATAKRWASPGSRRRDATRTACRSRPERCASSLIAATSRFQSSGPSVRTRTRAGLSGSSRKAGRGC